MKTPQKRHRHCYPRDLPGLVYAYEFVAAAGDNTRVSAPPTDARQAAPSQFDWNSHLIAAEKVMLAAFAAGAAAFAAGPGSGVTVPTAAVAGGLVASFEACGSCHLGR